MALLLALAFGLLATANAGFMQMMTNNQGMQGMQGYGQQGGMMVPVNNQPCAMGQDGHMPEGCAIPEMNMDNMEEYLQRQLEQQQYETQAMAERIKAQFEALMRNVTMKKQRYAMSIVTEFISACSCAQSSSQIYSAVFLQQARILNLTDAIETYDDSRMPYEAKSEEEARLLVFGGLVKTMCEAASTYLTFADQVNQRLLVLQGKK